MKQTTKAEAGHVPAERSARSRPLMPGDGSGSSLAQLSAMVNGSPKMQALAQLKNTLQQAPQVQRMAKLAAQINCGACMPANGKAAMERETDTMGPRSPSMQLQPAAGTETTFSVRSEGSAAAPVAQRMKMERAPEDKQIYSMSNNKNVVAGMKTPNHELYLKDPGKIAAINAAMKASPLEVYPGSQRDLFTHRFTTAELRFKQAIGPKSLDLQNVYEKQVKPGIEVQRGGLLQQAMDVLPAQDSGINVGGISKALRSVTASLELFKKLIQTTLASRPDTRGIEQARKLVAGMEDAIYARATNDELLTDALAKIWVILEFPTESGIPTDPLILETVDQIKDHALDLSVAMPEEGEIDLISFHKFNFQVDALATVRRKDSNLLLYRACDVMASTVMGNELNQRNAQQLKVYQEKGGAFHFAAKILTEGADWVTLESFAASDRERPIIGVEDIRNLDQSWQYTMYGSLQGEEEHLSDEDRFFTSYTKLRYHLKGITGKGRFRSLLAERPKPEKVESNEFEHLFQPIKGGIFSKSVSSAEQAADLLKHLQATHAVSNSGIVSAEVRTVQDLKLHLLPKYRPLADEIRNILLPHVPTNFIKSLQDSDAANLAAWKELAGVGGEPDEILKIIGKNSWELLSKIQTALQERAKDASRVSQEAWLEVGEELAAL